MFKNQPKGLFVAALSNMGERFGFYTMMAILTLFLMSKYDLDGVRAGAIYSGFYGAIYGLSLVGGLLADKLGKYKGIIMSGLIIMSLGYAILAIPSIFSLPVTIGALFIVAFGNGLFKGNLQALVGQLYDNEKYSKMRDYGFQIFYMFINVGAIFAPMIATGVRNWWLKSQGFIYNADMSNLCHSFLDGKMSEEVASGKFTELATQVSGGVAPANLTDFANSFLNAFNTGYHYAFATAIVAMGISLLIFALNKKNLPNPRNTSKRVELSQEEIHQDAKEIKQRLYALFAVFAVVIFFWFSFHQNGLTLTMFAKDYTHLQIGSFKLSAEIFQSANPFFVVFLTPIVMWFFAALSKRGVNLSTARKIAIGMAIAATAYVIMAVGSIGVPAHDAIKDTGLATADRVTPWLLIATYLTLTIAELFISPLGLSFVSKVAPVKMQGLMQGCWLGATAIGNLLLFIGPIMYQNLPISVAWSIFAVVCFVSMGAMLGMVKWLETITKD